MRPYFADAMIDGESSDGLIQRFQLLIWPEKPKQWSYEDCKKDAEALQTAEEVYRRIAALDAENPLRLKFSEEAQDFFQSWLTDWMNIELREDGLNTSLESHFAKYRSLMPSLALLFSLADGNVNAVDLEHTMQAAGWCKYLKGHAERVYSAKTYPGYSAALSLKNKIEKGFHGKQEDTFTVRDLYRKGWADLSTPDRARAALDILVDYQWIRVESSTSEAIEVGRVNRGRPSEKYRINPAIIERIRLANAKPNARETRSAETVTISN